MGLIAAIAGRYSGTWNSLALGILDDSGWRLTQTVNEQLINRTDQYAQTLIDTVYQGQDWAVDFVMQEYGAAGLSTVISPFGTLGQLGVIAQLGTGVAQSLVLTATAATPAAATPATLTATGAKLAQGSGTSFNLTSALRVVPVKLQLLPLTVSAAVKHFATT